MATVRQVLSSFDSDSVVYEAVITTTDFLVGNVTGFRAVSTPEAVGQAYGELFRPDGTRKAASTCLVGTDTTVSLSGTSRLPVTFSAEKNRWVGVRGNFLGPAHPIVAGAGRAGAGAAQVHKTYPED